MNGSRCTFYLKEEVAGGFRYTPFSIPSYHRDDNLHTKSPPLIGDRVVLRHPLTGLISSFRVLEREHQYNSYGSPNWPVSDPEPRMPDMIRFTVEEVGGLFADEADSP